MAARVAQALALAALLAGCAGGGKAADAGGAGPVGGAGLGFTGLVVDEAVRPLPGVDVQVSGGPNATTGADGTFAFRGLEAGTYVVTAARRGYASATTQVDLSPSQAPPLAKLVLITDASTVAYADVYSIDGLVECGIYFIVGYFAACSAPNTASTIACPATGVCAGNLTGDRSLILQPITRAPQWLQMEAAWEPTTDTAKVMMVQSGATNEERVAAGELTILNETVGPSPNLNIVSGKLLDDQKFGSESTLIYMRLHTAPNAPVGEGLAVEQPFKLLIHVFFGYQPPAGWRFSEDPATPPPT